MHAGSSILRPLASAASQGNTFDFPPTVAPEFTWVGVVQVVP